MQFLTACTSFACTSLGSAYSIQLLLAHENCTVQSTRTSVHPYRRYKKGGHFAALEVPELLAQDMREFFLIDLRSVGGNLDSKL